MEYTELTIIEIQKILSLGRASAYRKAKSEEWSFIDKPLDRGGTKRYYLVPKSILPSTGDKPKENISKAIQAEIVEYDESIQDLVPPITVPEKELIRAQLKAELCDKILEEYKRSKVKIRAIRLVLEAYNSGMLLPRLYKLEGSRTERAVRMWLKDYEDNDRDFKVLTRLSKASTQKRATIQEQNFLLGILLDANRIKIGTAIRKLKQFDRLGAIKSPTSSRALRRWCEEWRDNNIQQWNLLRMGEKFLKDNNILSLSRANNGTVQ